MKLGTLLASIAGTVGETREQLKAEALERIKGHKEEKLLMECYASACAGRTYISLGRNILPPECLWEEGFIIRDTGCMYNYHFE